MFGIGDTVLGFFRLLPVERCGTDRSGNGVRAIRSTTETATARRAERQLSGVCLHCEAARTAIEMCTTCQRRDTGNVQFSASGPMRTRLPAVRPPSTVSHAYVHKPDVLRQVVADSLCLRARPDAQEEHLGRPR